MQGKGGLSRPDRPLQGPHKEGGLSRPTSGPSQTDKRKGGLSRPAASYRKATTRKGGLSRPDVLAVLYSSKGRVVPPCRVLFKGSTRRAGCPARRPARPTVTAGWMRRVVPPQTVRAWRMAGCPAIRLPWYHLCKEQGGLSRPATSHILYILLRVEGGS